MVVHWGDAELGNMVFENQRTAAILDWELCGRSLGEEDLAHWMAVDWFLSTGLGNPRIDGLASREDTVACYETALGRPTHAVARWFEFALVRMGLIFRLAAVQARAARGGSGELRPNPMMVHLNDVLSGSSWSQYAA